MLQNAKVTAFTVSELFKEKHSPPPPPPTQIRVNIKSLKENGHFPLVVTHKWLKLDTKYSNIIHHLMNFLQTTVPSTFMTEITKIFKIKFNMAPEIMNEILLL